MNGRGFATSYDQIGPDWHRLTTSDGVFFGYSRLQVFEKAAAAQRRRERADIAADEQRRELALADAYRGGR